MVNKNSNYAIREINVLVDSRSSEYGDEYSIDLGENAIIAEKDNLIRINLTYFNMYNNLHSVNFRNGTFKTVFNINGRAPVIKISAINFQNYYSIHEIASEFAVKIGLLCEEITQLRFVVKDIKNTILNKFKPFLVNGGIDSTAGRASHDGNHLMDITLEAINDEIENDENDEIENDEIKNDEIEKVVNHGIENIEITFEDSDLYLILGGLKSPENKTSLLVIISDNDINIKGYFPMQRISDNNICLRCDVIGNNLASPISRNGYNNSINSLHYNSDVLGIFNTDSEMIEYINSNNIFSADVRGRSLKRFKLFLTDSKNKKLITPGPIGTAAGLQNTSGDFIKNQNTNGNLYFKALLNIELIQLSRSPN
jgi:hypothetical protein